MKTIVILIGILFYTVQAVDICGQTSAGSEDYVWPTDASQYLTSAFCEYRGRRFHAGIDVKTWGRVGYKVFAIRPGYVWRISVSPYGYGKSIYLKLDTGEIAQYGHLSRFSDTIQKIVDAEQTRLGKYRLNKYFKPDQVPVQQGEVIAYTGQTGIGAPHLHFEIRDSRNRPINPLSKGFRLPDRISPIVTKISVSPLDVRSQVNGDFVPLILQPKWQKPGIYSVDEIPTVWGNVGLAIACYDKDSNSANAFGLYSFKLYVDDVLRFQYQFDKVSFQENPMVELERDYRLYRRGLGRFHKLYKDKHNKRSHYRPNRTWAGVLKSTSLAANPSLHSDAESENPPLAELESGALFPGTHQYRIEVADFFGNTSAVVGKFRVGEYFSIQPVLSEGMDGSLNLEDVVSYDLRRIEDLSTSVLIGKRWQPLRLDYSMLVEDAAEKGGEGDVPDTEGPGDRRVLLLRQPPTNSLIMKFVARDQFDVESYPYYHLGTGVDQGEEPVWSVNFDYYDDYLRLEANSSILLPLPPRVTLYPGRGDSTNIPLYQLGLKKYVGRIAFDQLHGDKHQVRIETSSPDGESFAHLRSFAGRGISSSREGKMFSDDRNFSVSFRPGSLYGPIYGHVFRDSLTEREADMVGEIYHAEPRDIPLNKGAMVHLVYPGDEAHPEKLGVSYRTRRGRWVLIDHELDRVKRTVSAKVFSLEKFVLMRDEVAPEITRIRPRHESRTTNRRPRISVNIKDRFAGIKSENDIVIMLDGIKLIAEYDPERDRIFYQVKQPLAKGRHDLSIWVQDRLRNEASRKTIFWID